MQDLKQTIQKFRCWLPDWIHFGHTKMSIVKRFNNTCKKIKCNHCERMFAINDDCRVLLPWDDEFEQFYKDFDKKDGGVMKKVRQEGVLN